VHTDSSLLVALLSGIAAGWVRGLVARLRAQSHELVRERDTLCEQRRACAYGDRAVRNEYAGRADHCAADVSIAKTTTLRYMLAPQLPLIAVDATQIRQVIMNLVLNAAEAAGSTTSIIVITTGVLYVDRSYLARTWLAPELPEGQYVFLEIIDDGPGMTAETLAKIFDPFAQLSSEDISADHASKNTRSGACTGGMIRAESAAASAAV
jgi:signal transduction histidine kinase